MSEWMNEWMKHQSQELELSDISIICSLQNGDGFWGKNQLKYKNKYQLIFWEKTEEKFYPN